MFTTGFNIATVAIGGKISGSKAALPYEMGFIIETDTSKRRNKILSETLTDIAVTELGT